MLPVLHGQLRAGATAPVAQQAATPCNLLRPGHPSGRIATLVRSSNGGGGGGLGDDLLDFMYAGKKLRKWYGEEGLVLPKDGGSPKDEDEEGPSSSQEDAGPRDQVLVLDAETVPMAEQVLLQLILARAKVKVLVKDTQAAKAGFGPYVQIVSGGANDASALRSALQGVKALVLCGAVAPGVLAAATAAGVPHIVLLSAVGAPPRGGFMFFRDQEMDVLMDKSREEQVRGAALAHTILRVGGLDDSDGGVKELRLTAGEAAGGAVSREDAASVVAQASLRDCSAGSLVVSIAVGGPGEPPRDWGEAFAQLIPRTVS